MDLEKMSTEYLGMKYMKWFCLVVHRLYIYVWD